MPEYDAGGDRNVEGMLGTELRDLQHAVRGFHDCLVHPADLAAEDKGILFRGIGDEGLQRDRTDGLFHAEDGPSFGVQPADRIQRIVQMLPVHAEFGPQGHFVDFRCGRYGRDAAQVNFISPEGISCPEDRSDVVGAADIVQDDSRPGRGQRLELLRIDTVQFNIQKFPPTHSCKITKIFRKFVDVDIVDIMKQDLQVFDLIKKERDRQFSGLELIASENYVSNQVMEAMGSVCTNKYAEGYPGRRYYGGCEVVDQIEQLAIDRLKKLYGAEYANVQPHSGAQANMAVEMAVLQPGDKFMGLSLAHGGHLTHGSPVNTSGLLFHPIPYGLDEHTGLIDYDEMERLALEEKPKMIIGGASAYSREWDYARMREIADKVGAILMIDMAHTAGLIAAGLLDNPVKYAHIVTSTTHKTLRGPRGGIILIGKDFVNPRGLTTPKGEVKMMSQVIDSYVFPGIQGGPLEHVIAAKAVAFYEAMQPEYVSYQKQVKANADAMAKAFLSRGYKVVSGGTDNHLMLIELRPKFPDVTGKMAEKELVKADITVNKNMVPFDSRSPFQTSGIRVGTPAVTSRGFQEKDMKDIVALIDTVLCAVEKYADNLEAPEYIEILRTVKHKVNMLTSGRPLNRY